MNRTLEDIIKTEKPTVVAGAMRIADEMLKKIRDVDDKSPKTDSDLSN